MMRAAVVTVAMLLGAACGPDSVPFRISLQLEPDPDRVDHCGGNSCSQIETSCNAAIGIQVVDANSGEPYINECIHALGGTNLCALVDQIDLDSTILPNTMVRIEVAIWPLNEDTEDCPQIQFNAERRYGGGQPQPAIAGQGYFRVGSTELAPVVLGCVDESMLDAPECRTENLPHITTHVIDFEDRLVVDGSLAERLTVTVAEPTYNSVNMRWLIQTTDQIELNATVTSPELTYEVDYPANFEDTACIQVISDDLGAVPAVRCYQAAPHHLVDNQLEAEGSLLDASTLDAIEQALGGGVLTSVVIGMVLDEDGFPAAGAEVDSTFGTVQYLNEDLTSVAGLTQTSASGVFVSVDAPYQGEGFDTNFWNASRDDLISGGTVIGGLLQNKVSIVILRLGLTDPKPLQ